MKPQAPRCWAVLAEFATPEELFDAARAARAAGYEKMEAYSPFPIHGIDKILGESFSPLGKIAFGGALLGLATALALQWWSGAVDYRLITGGKPLFALAPAIPIIFELSVLGGALGTVAGLFYLNRMPTFSHPFFNYSRADTASCDRFLLAIESTHDEFDAAPARQLLTALGGQHVEVVEA